MTNEKKEVIFKNCATYGDQIEALVENFTNASIGEFVLSEALKKVID